MKAILCTRYGPPEVLHLGEVDKPAPKNNEVLVKIHTTSVTVGDTRIRGFRVPLSFWLPGRLALGILRPKKAILGSIFAGDVEAVGKDVRIFKKGDKVFGSNGHNFGAYAEYICIPENRCIATIPKNFTYAEATALLWGGTTALHFLRKANIQKGQKVLIYGASGSVGTSAIQIAKHFGAEVTGVCSVSNLDMVRSLGADQVIDYTTTDFTKKPEKYDVIFDTVGKSQITGTIKSLTDTGTYIHTVTTPATAFRIKLGLINSKRKLIGGSFTPNIELISELKKLAEDGSLKPVIDRTYRIEEIAEAHRYVDQGHKKGNVVITVGHASKT